MPSRKHLSSENHSRKGNSTWPAITCAFKIAAMPLNIKPIQHVVCGMKSQPITLQIIFAMSLNLYILYIHLVGVRFVTWNCPSLRMLVSHLIFIHLPLSSPCLSTRSPRTGCVLACVCICLYFRRRRNSISRIPIHRDDAMLRTRSYSMPHDSLWSEQLKLGTFVVMYLLVRMMRRNPCGKQFSNRNCCLRESVYMRVWYIYIYIYVLE